MQPGCQAMVQSALKQKHGLRWAVLNADIFYVFTWLLVAGFQRSTRAA
jgi:hypothetical protein